VAARLAFYRKDYALVLDAAARPQGARCNFVRDSQGQINWWLFQAAPYGHDRLHSIAVTNTRLTSRCRPCGHDRATAGSRR
jgi:hypothetical protein